MNEIVLDTSVLLAGFLSPWNPAGRIVDALRAQELRLVADDRVLDVYRKALRRQFFDKYLKRREREWIMEFLSRESRIIATSRPFLDLATPSDACFLEVASEAGVLLVTARPEKFPPALRRNVEVVTPKEYYESMGSATF